MSICPTFWLQKIIKLHCYWKVILSHLVPTLYALTSVDDNNHPISSSLSWPPPSDVMLLMILPEEHPFSQLSILMCQLPKFQLCLWSPIAELPQIGQDFWGIWSINAYVDMMKLQFADLFWRLCSCTGVKGGIYGIGVSIGPCSVQSSLYKLIPYNMTLHSAQ